MDFFKSQLKEILNSLLFEHKEKSEDKTIKESAVIDIGVLLSDPEFVSRATQIGFPIITEMAVRQISENKVNDNDEITKNADLIYRKLTQQDPISLISLPCGKPLLGEDKIFKYQFLDADLFVLVRNKFKTNSNHDSKLREIAKDYNLTFVTEDGEKRKIFHHDGIKVISRANVSRLRASTESKDESTSQIKPFNRVTKIVVSKQPVLYPKNFPTEGDSIKIGFDGYSVKLGPVIGTGGEGTVFEIVNDHRVAKIYRKERLTSNRVSKLELMASRGVSRKGICWPEHLVLSEDNCIIGYVTQWAKGHSLSTSVFVLKELTKDFPAWKRENLLNLCIEFLQQIQFLHSLNVLVGDINPSNILVDGDGREVYIVDADSFQVEGYPCPVGTANFSPPKLQNVDFKSTLRSNEDELFAVATMLFMIIFLGKHPYSQQGGESPAKNIINAKFPYPFGTNKGENVSLGPWGDIWDHLPFKLKELFHKSFEKQKSISVSVWLGALSSYRESIANGKYSNDINPKPEVSSTSNYPRTNLKGNLSKDIKSSEKIETKSQPEKDDDSSGGFLEASLGCLALITFLIIGIILFGPMVAFLFVGGLIIFGLISLFLAEAISLISIILIIIGMIALLIFIV